MQKINALREELKTNGFVTVRGLVPAKKCEAVLKSTFGLLCRFAEIPEEFKRQEKPWKNPKFHSYMQKLRDSNPETFGAMYDAALSNVMLANLLTDTKVIETVGSLLNVPAESLSLSGHIERMDPPTTDTRNLYNWHQERSYYPQNRDGLNGLAIWIPLMDVDLDGGTLIVGKGSHTQGFIKVSPQRETPLHSTQYQVPDEIANKYEQVTFPVQAGDALIMYMTTIHKSSMNKSNRFRFVVIGRYHIATADDFTPYRYTYTSNKYVKNLLEKRGDDVSDLF